MSIILAKIQENTCFFFSDTIVSELGDDPTAFGKGKLRLPPEEGSLKLHILQKKICIAFAGEVEVCEEIIMNLFKAKPDNIPNYIRGEIIRKGADCEFILALVDRYHQPRLFHIDEFNFQEGKTFWIGNKNAFKEFQSYFVDSDIIDLLQKTQFAFKKMIENTKVPTVGDFIISCQYNKSFSSFIYDNFLTYYGSMKVIVIQKGCSANIGNETNIDGAFTVSNLISDQITKQAICLFFELGELAFLYFPISKDYSETRPIVIEKVGRRELQKLVNEKYGINLIGFSNEDGKIIYKN